MTGTLKARVGGAWVPILGSGQEAAATARWNSAWGVIGSASMTASHTGITSSANPGTVINNSTVTVTTVAGRRYRISYNPLPYCDTANELVIIAITYDGTIVYSSAITVPNTGNSQGIFLEYFHAPTAGTHTYAASAWRGSTASNINFGAAVNQPTTMAVEDVGPVTPASIAPPTAGPRVVASGNALGIVAVGSLTGGSPQTIAASTWAAFTNPLSVFLATGRRYRVAFALRAVQMNDSVARTFQYRLITNPGVAFGNRYNYYAGQYLQFADDWIIDGDDALHSITVEAGQAAGAMGVYTETGGQFYVEDVGPNTYPALPIPATPPGWIPLSGFTNGWTAFGGGEPPPAYRKIGDMVQVRGSIKNATPMTNPSAQTFVTLPVGFRPQYTMYPPCFGVGSDGYGCPAILIAQADGALRAIRNVTNVAPHSQTAFDFQFSTTP